MKKISIITINYNNDDGLKKTIESVIPQTYLDFEYIIIDGGSTDKSVSVIKQYADKITYWVSEPDKGIYHAMNKGIEQAKGEYCLFLNSGDCLHISTILEDVFSHDIKEDIVYGKIVENIDYPEKLRFSFMFGWSLPHPATFIKRDLFVKVGLYDETNRIISDWTFFMKALYIYHCTYKHIPLHVSDFDLGGISSSEEYHSLIREERRHFLEQYFPLFWEDYQDLLVSKDELATIKHSRIYKYFILLRKLLGKSKIAC